MTATGGRIFRAVYEASDLELGRMKTGFWRPVSKLPRSFKLVSPPVPYVGPAPMREILTQAGFRYIRVDVEHSGPNGGFAS